MLYSVSMFNVQISMFDVFNVQVPVLCFDHNGGAESQPAWVFVAKLVWRVSMFCDTFDRSPLYLETAVVWTACFGIAARGTYHSNSGRSLSILVGAQDKTKDG